ncbi:MAG: sugar ABC transporter permease [Chloroflexi bacterium]|nr:sugar ABC transporter permease [Chloroflexota bacterium]
MAKSTRLAQGVSLSAEKQEKADADWRRQVRSHLIYNKLAYYLITPSIVMIVLIYFYPMLNGIWQSMHYFSRVQPWAYRFTGLENYLTALQTHDFWVALRTSAIWTLGGVLASYLLGLAAALLLNGSFRGRGIYRSVLLLPWVVPPVVAGTSWMWMYADQDGIINITLRQLGIISKPIYWLSVPHLAMLAVIIVHVWRSFPFMMITVLAALSGISDDIYEAGRIDGASNWQLLRYITFPLIFPISVTATVLSSIWTFNDFGTIFVLTGGGPAGATTTLIIQSYKEAFQRYNVGYGTSLAVIAMILMMGIGVVYLRLQARERDI